jgi:hypothetical protein
MTRPQPSALGGAAPALPISNWRGIKHSPRRERRKHGFFMIRSNKRPPGSRCCPGRGGRAQSDRGPRARDRDLALMRGETLTVTCPACKWTHDGGGESQLTSSSWSLAGSRRYAGRGVGQCGVAPLALLFRSPAGSWRSLPGGCGGQGPGGYGAAIAARRRRIRCRPAAAWPRPGCVPGRRRASRYRRPRSG